MRHDLSFNYHEDPSLARCIDPEGSVPDLVYHYTSDSPDDELHDYPSGVTVALFSFIGRAAIGGGGDWVWGDAHTTPDELLRRYLAGDWEEN